MKRIKGALTARLCMLLMGLSVSLLIAAKNVGPQQSFTTLTEVLTSGSEAIVPIDGLTTLDIGSSAKPVDAIYATTINSSGTVAAAAAATVGTTLTVTGATALNGTVTGDGGDALSGFLQKQTTSTTVTLTASQCGQTLVNDSADVMTLPEASTVPGCRFTFVVNNASNFDINPNDGTDKILPFADYAGAGATVSPSAGDAIRGATAGMSITIEAVSSDNWCVIGGAQGTWADVN